MKRVVFNFVFKGVNVGDLATSPLDYYDIPYSQVIPDDFDRLAKLPKKAILLYGGGGLLCLRDHFYSLQKRCNKLVTWGIGFNWHGHDWRKRPHDVDLLREFDLVGIRDYTEVEQVHHNAYHVPCVSCKHPAFDKSHRVDDDVRVYQHYEIDIPEFKSYNRRTNHLSDGGPETAIDFIAGCNKLITNSFHGAYWGMLLGKQVYCYKPFSSKFLNLPHVAYLKEEGEFLSVEAPAPNYVYLYQCRQKNDQFYRVFSMFRATCK